MVKKFFENKIVKLILEFLGIAVGAAVAAFAIEEFLVPCTILDFEGNWMKVAAETKKGHVEKLIPVSSVLSMESVKEAK